MENQEYVKQRKFKKSWLLLSPVQLIVLGYILFAVAGTILLSLPLSLNPGVELSFIDALFTATSAISVTGLTVVGTAETFSITGKVILVFLFQFGGIGIMTLGTLFFVLRGNQLSLRNRLMIRADQNQTTLQGMVILALFILKMAIILELLGTIFFAALFLSSYHIPFPSALGMAAFHSVSAFTNAGFDLFGNSLIDFKQDYLMQTATGILLLAGAIGFPVLLELYSFFNARRGRERFRFSLYTKVTTFTFGFLLIAGFAIVLLFETRGSLAGTPWHQQISVTLFHTLSTRSGGLSTIDLSVFNSSSLFFFSLLMFIGASPSSCGGGIRTTTFAVMLLTVAAFLRGQNSIKIFHRELYQEDVIRAMVVFFMAAMLVFAATMLLMEFEPFSATELIFEVCSAFGTTGLSMGITSNLTTAGKVVITILMFIGRIGILSLLLLFHRRKSEERYHFIKEHIIIG